MTRLISASTSDPAFGLVVLAAVMASAALFDVLARLVDRERRMIERVARHAATTIAAVRPGELVRVDGEVVPLLRTLTAPLRRRTCVQLALRVDSPTADPIDLIAEERAVDFLVRDAGGAALVRVEGATMLVPFDVHAKLSAERTIDVGGRSCSDGMAREGALEPGARVALLGVARWPVEDEAMVAGYREGAPRLVFAATPEAPLFITNAARAFRRL